MSASASVAEGLALGAGEALGDGTTATPGLGEGATDGAARARLALGLGTDAWGDGALVGAEGGAGV